jgi:hypothetical protein
LPNESDRIQRISNAYITIRYSTAATAGLVQQFAKDVNAFGSATLSLRR